MRGRVRRTRRYAVSDTEIHAGRLHRGTAQHWRRTHCSERVHGPLAAAGRARALRIHRRSSPGPHARPIRGRRGQHRGTSLSCVPENTAQPTSSLALFWAVHTRHTRTSPQKPWKLPHAPQGELSDGDTDSSRQGRSPRSQGRSGGATGGVAHGPLPHTCPAQIWDLPSPLSAGGRGLARSLCNKCGHKPA